MSGLAHGDIEHDAKQFSDVVVGDTAFGPTVVWKALEPCIETRLLRRLAEVSRTALEFGDLFTQIGEISRFVRMTGTNFDDSAGGAGHAFTEPQRSCVVLLRIVNRLERLWADTFDVPEMEEFVGREAGDVVKILLQQFGIDVDRSGIGVLHAASGRAAWEMIEERVAVEGTIIHPRNGCGHDVV